MSSNAIIAHKSTESLEDKRSKAHTKEEEEETYIRNKRKKKQGKSSEKGRRRRRRKDQGKSSYKRRRKRNRVKAQTKEEEEKLRQGRRRRSRGRREGTGKEEKGEDEERRRNKQERRPDEKRRKEEGRNRGSRRRTEPIALFLLYNPHPLPPFPPIPFCLCLFCPFLSPDKFDNLREIRVNSHLNSKLKFVIIGSFIRNKDPLNSLICILAKRRGSWEMSRSSENLRTRVGKYELGRVLGEGTFAKVKYARNVDTGQPVAIKILEKEKVFKDRLVQQIKREISTMKLIKHPNVVQLYEVMASKTKIYFVLEYISGGELFNRIASKGKLKEDEARKYFQQLINAVDFCHSRGVYHRDLKPENLLLDSHFNLKVSDFGLSALPQQLREDGLLHTTCGTPNYVAPEVIVPKGYDGAKADIWSCGVILFVLLAGYLPFDDSNLMNLYRKIHRADFRYPPWFPPGARRLISRILNPNPKLRITIPQIYDDTWFKKGFVPPKSFIEGNAVSLEDIDAVFNVKNEQANEASNPTLLNAFEIISLSKGLNLSGLFEKKQEMKQEQHFTSKRPASEIVSKIEETVKPLGFEVQKHDYKMRLHCAKTGRKGKLSVATEVFQMAPSLYVVEVRKARGDTLEYQNFYQNLSKGLKDIVWKDAGELGI